MSAYLACSQAATTTVKAERKQDTKSEELLHLVILGHELRNRGPGLATPCRS